MKRSRAITIVLLLLQFIFLILITLIAQDLWSNYGTLSGQNRLWRAIAGIGSFIMYFLITFIIERMTNQLTILNKHLSSQLDEAKNELQRYEGRIEYNWEHAFDDTFARVLEKLQEGSDYEIRLLNYTGTGFPDQFCKNAALLLSKAIKNAVPTREQECLVPHNFAISVPTIKEPSIEEPRLFDLRTILDKVRGCGVLNIDQLRDKIGTTRRSLDKEIKQIIESMESNRSQAAYLLRENFWLWDPASSFKLVRMYYLSPNKSRLENTADRFCFICASIVDSLFSPRYSLGILPGRLDYAHSDQFNYYVINALSSDHSLGWVLSGLGTREHEGSPEELPYSIVFRAGEDKREWIVGCKCQQIGDYSKLIWRQIKKGSLVLYDSEMSPPALYIRRFSQLYERIHTALTKHRGDQRGAAFNEFFTAFNRMVDLAENIGLAKQMDAPISDLISPQPVCGEISWKKGDLEEFQHFFL